jgi:hypothetical protein
MIEAILAGRIEIGAGRPPRLAPDYLRIDPTALSPNPANAERIVEAMIAAGQLAESARGEARLVFRDDLFAAARQMP